MKIIKNGQGCVKFTEGYIAEVILSEGSSQRYTCAECGCEFECELPEDIHSRVVVPDGCESSGFYGYQHYAMCPNCGAKISFYGTYKNDFPQYFEENFYEYWHEKLNKK